MKQGNSITRKNYFEQPCTWLLKSKGRKHIYRAEAEKKVKRGFKKRYCKKKGEYDYGTTVDKLKRAESKK